MSFSVRLAPGVRVSASSRGVRASVGGGGVRYSTRIAGGGSRRSGTASVNRQLGPSPAAQAKLAEGQRLQHLLNAIMNLHREEFPAASAPVAPDPPAVDQAAIRAKHRSEAKKSTSVFARSARKSALSQADERAAAEVADGEATRVALRAEWQRELDARWAALLANDPEAVLATLASAFEDNEAAAAAVGVDGDEVSLLVIVPPVGAVPERQPTLTSAGNPSLKKLTKAEIASFYAVLVCGHVLVTVKEAFATAPKIAAARIVAVRLSDPDAYGNRAPQAMLAARFERARFDGIQWATANAPTVVEGAAAELLYQFKGAAKEMQPLDLTSEPELAGLVGAVDFEELQ